LSAIDAMVRVFLSGAENTASRGRKVLQLLRIVPTLHRLPWPACERFETHVDRPKRLMGRSWRTFVQRLARCEAIWRHGREHQRYGDMNASWEDA
jgi:hypothetical protein